jgi:hypothetical protein
VRATSQRLTETFAISGERTVGEALDIARLVLGVEFYLDPRGQLICVGNES